MPSQQKRNNLLHFLLIFALVYVGSQVLLRQFFPGQFGGPKQIPIPVQLTVANVTMGNNPVVTVKDNTAAGFTIPSRCPLPPFDVFRVEGAGSGQLVPLTTSSGSGAQTAVPCTDPPAVPAHGSIQVPLAPWKYSLFGKSGTYEVRLTLPAEIVSSLQAAQSGGTVTNPLTARFTLSEVGTFTKLFRTFISAPFLNFLIFAGSWLPGHNLGVAIILLTILVKLLLFIPTQHALEGQKKMQMLQPKLNELKKKYGNDQQRIQEETLKLWKEHKVNPFQSCLPTLVQFPVLIGLFYVIRDESTLGLSRHLIYPFYQHLNWSFGTMFLGLDLLKPNIWVMPILLVVLQYLQMKLTFAIADNKKKKNQKVIDVGEQKKEPKNVMDTQQQVMLYALPLMIGFFAIQFPAAVSLYWGISTLFAIGQQIIVNREHLRV